MKADDNKFFILWLIKTIYSLTQKTSFGKLKKTLLAYNAVITILLFWRIDVLIFK